MLSLYGPQFDFKLKIYQNKLSIFFQRNQRQNNDADGTTSLAVACSCTSTYRLAGPGGNSEKEKYTQHQRSIIDLFGMIVYSGQIWATRLRNKQNFYLLLFVVESLKPFTFGESYLNLHKHNLQLDLKMRSVVVKYRMKNVSHSCQRIKPIITWFLQIKNQVALV